MIYNFLESLCGQSTSAEVLSAGAVVVAVLLIVTAINVLWLAFYSLPFFKGR